LLFRVPISHVERWTAAQPTLTNALLIAVLVVVGTGLWLRADRFFIGCGVVFCGLTWWLAQDFGVLGGVATDPNSALPLGLLLISSSPGWQERTSAERESLSTPSAPRVAPLLAPTTAALSALGIGALVVAPVFVAGLLLGPADSAAVAADSGGGVIALPHRPTPPFTLTDQNGRTISEADFQGKLTLVTFFDPVCSDECPLIANQLAIADRQLGGLAGRVQIVAIDSNPVFHNVADVAAFTTSHGLNTLPNWHFLAGPVSDLQDLISAYGIVIQVPTVGMLAHGEGIYFIGEDGRQVAYLGDGANEALTHSYADTVRDEVRRLLA
jgi:cytochrome oxidase Cu insertion factor (SCO1/SenC/PrrC family)